MDDRKNFIIGALVVACLVFGSVSRAQTSWTASSTRQPDPDRYMVAFMNPSKGKAALKTAGAQILLDLSRHNAVAARIPGHALEGLRKNPNIQYIEPDPIRELYGQQVTPWGITEVQADQSLYAIDDWEADNRKICIIDSGYTPGHEDLPDDPIKVTASPDSGTGDPFYDGCGHGTHVAGTIAALDNYVSNENPGVGVVGVLPSNTINLHIVKAFANSCGWAYSSDLIQAIDACALEGNANIVSMSFGGTRKSRTEERAIKKVYNENNVLFFAAAGNAGDTSKSYPASYNPVVSMGAVDENLTVASFSQQNNQVELAAPGVSVLSTVPSSFGTRDRFFVTENGIETEYGVFAIEGSPTSPPVTGKLVKCPGLLDCSNVAGESGNVICLIERGVYLFSEKVIECRKHGGDGAVIYDNSIITFTNWSLGGVVTEIPSVALSMLDGQYLTDHPGDSATLSIENIDYEYFSGTSMSTPHASGVAALVWSYNTSCTNQEIRDALAATAMDLPVDEPDGRDNAYGYGLVQAYDAVTYLANSCGGDTSSPPNQCYLGQFGDSCTSNDQCCSNKCKGPSDGKKCK